MIHESRADKYYRSIQDILEITTHYFQLCGNIPHLLFQHPPANNHEK